MRGEGGERDMYVRKGSVKGEKFEERNMEEGKTCEGKGPKWK